MFVHCLLINVIPIIIQVYYFCLSLTLTDCYLKAKVNVKSCNQNRAMAAVAAALMWK